VRAFATLSLVGMLDAATRGAALTFLPFVLADKGMDAAQVSALFVLVYGGGAAGKFALGWLGDRVGVMGLIWGSKGVTALLLVGFLPLPVVAIAPLLVVFGFGLNGTSSVLYASVARITPARQRARRYGIYYTGTEAATAVAPVVYGVVADAAGLGVTLVAMAAATALILPASLTLGRYLKLPYFPEK
jgi:predicted MFS family arabinose efflux permease